MPLLKTRWLYRVVLGLAALTASLTSQPSHARAYDDPHFVQRSSQELVVGTAAVGAYSAASTLWVASLLTDARFEYRLIPALAVGALGAWALAAYDQQTRFAQGTLANLSSGATVGLAIGATWVLYNRAGASPWSDRTVSSLLWAGATIGAGIGGLSARGGTTPGRAAFTGAASLFTATATGLLAASLGNVRSAPRRGLLASALSLEVGVIAAGWLGRRWNPTLQRVSQAAALAVTGALLASTSAWAATGRPDLADARGTWGAAAGGLVAGAVLGWVWHD